MYQATTNRILRSLFSLIGKKAAQKMANYFFLFFINLLRNSSLILDEKKGERILGTFFRFFSRSRSLNGNKVVRKILCKKLKFPNLYSLVYHLT